MHATAPLGTSATPSKVDIVVFGSATATGPTGPATGGTPYLGFENPIETVSVGEDATGGTVGFNVTYGWIIENKLLNDIGHASWEGVVPFTVATEQQVTFGQPIVKAQESSGSGANFAANVGSGATPGGGYATLSASLTTSSSYTAGGGGVGPISVTPPITSTTGTSGVFLRSFTVNVRPQPPAPIVGPQVAFKINESKMEDGEEGRVAKWFNDELKDPVKAAIRNGRRVISIAGYASTTGKRKKNRNLSEERARVIERILRGMAGSNANINVFFFGEDSATTPDEKEDPTWRRATVRVETPTTTSPGAPTKLPGP
jgi:hypothetical protein